MRRALLMLLSLSAVVLVAPTASAAIATTAGQSTYTPQDPVRVLDTRTVTGGHPGTLGAGEVFDLTIPGAPAGATAVVLNVTAVGASAATNVRAYPTPSSGSAVPTVSNLNVAPGITVADLVTVQLGTGNRVRLRNDAGNVHLLADLAGFYVDGGAGSGFHPLAPTRLVDTRQTGTPLQPGESRKVEVRLAAGGGDSGVASNASAVVLNVTAVTPTSPTFLTVYPDPANRPIVSNLNPRAGDTVAALVVAKVDDATDSVQIFNNSGSTQVVVDLAGWYEPGAGDVFHPVSPYRALDTRSTGAVVAGSPQRLTLAGGGPLPWHATSVALTVTAVSPSTSTNVVVYPSSIGGSRPTASTVNLGRGQTVPNAAIVRAGANGQVVVDNAVQSVHVIVDVAGWFGPAGDGWDISWPQCTASGSTTSNHPTGGGYAVIGLTRGTFTSNTCFDDEFIWAASLPGEPAVYLNTDANVNDPEWKTPGGACADPSTAATSACGNSYGARLAQFAINSGIPTTPTGGKPFIWLDVEGPYTNGPFWTDSVATNRAVVAAAIVRLRGNGYRVGIYSDRASSKFPDWKLIMGAYVRTDVQNWVFRAVQNADNPNPASVCTPAESFSGGPVVMEQISTAQSGEPYDVNHAC